MQDHDLDDLIIDNINPKNSKTKSFLTIIALAIVVLIIAIILTKIILKDPNNNVILEENSIELLSPDLTLQNVTEEIVKKPLIPIIPTIEKVEKADKVERTKPATINAVTEPILVDTPKEPTTVEKIETVKITNDFNIDEETKRKAAEAKKLAQEEAEKEKVLAAQKEAEAKEAEAKKAVNQDIVNPYFIQVGSFSQTPSQRFLAVIKSSGFQYQITDLSTSGTKKLLIGPYRTKTEADNALVRVKDRINKSAYIIRK